MSDWVTTSTLIENLRQGAGDTGWVRFVSRFRAPIIAFARRTGLPEPDAEDVAQETLLAFADGLRRATYDPAKGRLSAWLFGIAARVAANARRRRAGILAAGAGGSDGGAQISDIPDDEVSRSWDLEWEKAMLEQCLAAVRCEVEPRTFEAFRLTALAGQSADEAAASVGMSREAVYVAKHRVLKRIRELRNELENIG